MTQIDDDALAVFEETLRLVATALPELALLTSGGEYVVPVDGAAGAITGVRLDQPARLPILLTRVGVAGEQPAPDQVSIAAHGWYRGEMPDPGDLMTSGHAALAVTTTPPAGHGAWIELTWTEPVLASGVVLANNVGSDSQLAAGLRVSVRTADGDWTQVLDSGQRFAQWRASRAEELTSRHPQDPELVFLDDLLLGAVAGEYPEARQGISKRRPKVGIERIGALRRAANAELLAARRREWTVHGIHRSFRFWTLEEKRSYVRYAADVARDVATLTPNVCFGFGATLAVVRENDLIPHDDDLDLIVSFERSEAADLPAALALLAEHLTSLGYTVVGEFFAHRHVRAPSGGKKIDVFVGLFDGDEVSWYPGPRQALKRADVFPTSTGSVFGIDVPLPASPETYLASQYGPDWRIPNPEFRHNWARAGYKDQSGVVTKPAPKPAAPPAPRPTLARRIARRLRRELRSRFGR